MNHDSRQWKHYVQLRDCVLNGDADPVAATELEELVLADEEMRRDFTELLHLDAALQSRGDAIDADAMGIDPRLPGASSVHPQAGTAPSALSSRRGYELLALVAALLMGVGFWMAGRTSSNGRVLAVMGDSSNCKWVSSDSPTFPGAKLIEGRMILDSGIAIVRFDQVDLTLEGPVDVELISQSRCRVRSGRVYAEVREGGEGFVVETPTSILTDRGTRFGVNVAAHGTSDLTVLEGLVDAEHRASGTVTQVRSDAGLRLTDQATVSLADASQEITGPPAAVENATRYQPIQISTAVGVGRDAYVISGQEKADSQTTGLLLVKNPPPQTWGKPWQRRVYLHFDLTLLDRLKIRSAKLQLQGAKTSMGYLSLTPDTVFSIYGLADESQEDWSEEQLNWDNCPGVIENRFEVDPDATVRLGQFVVSSDQPDGAFEIEGQVLVDFLREDRRGGVTMILVSETVGRGQSYVHGFAGKRHRSLSPPTLRLGVAKSNAVE